MDFLNSDEDDEELPSLEELLQLQQKNNAKNVTSDCSTSPTFEMYKKRKDAVVPNAGILFEQATNALYALKLTANKNVSDFKMTTNNDALGDIDDQEIPVTFQNGQKRTFLFQLKHRHKDERVTRDMLTKEFVNHNKKTEKSKYYLPQYLKSVANLDANKENVVYILYTNGDTDLEDGCKLSFKKEPALVVKKCHEMEYKNLLVNNRGTQHSLFQLRPEVESDSDEELEQSCKKFYLFTQQHNVESAQQKIKEILSNLFHNDILEVFMNFMEYWWSANFVLTKHLVLVKLTDLALSPYVRTISRKSSNEKTEFLKQVMKNFEMTIIEEDPDNVVANIWQEIENHHNWEVPIQKPSKNGLSDIEKTRILWQLGKVPLIVKADESNFQLIKEVLKFLHRKIMNKRIILLGRVDRSEFEGWDIFENFLDVVQRPEDQWSTAVMENFNISLQGRQEICLKQFVNIDRKMAECVTTKQLLQMSQKQYLLIGKQNTTLPEFHIPRSVLKEREIIGEHELFEKLQEKLKVICARSGTGKSILMQVLNHNCPPDSWAAHVNLINYNCFLDRNPDIESITSEFLKLNEESNVKMALLENGKMEIFLDGLDELDKKHLNLVGKWVNVMLSKHASVWIASRSSLRKHIHKIFKVKTIKIEHLSEEQQKRYIEIRLQNKYDSEKIDTIVTAIFESVEVHDSRHVLGIPLQLHILTEIFLHNENIYENLKKENIFGLPQMFRYFFAGKKMFTFEKMGVDERTGEQLGLNFEKYLEQYEIPALKVCLTSEEFEKLGIDETECESFLKGIKANGDKYGIIKRFTKDNIPIFDHQTFAEYFASLWFKKNKDKFPVELYLESDLSRMFDSMMAEHNLLHLAVIHENIDEFLKHFDAKFDETDEGGRTALHLAACYGSPMCCEIQRECERYMKMVNMLVNKCSLADLRKRDSLFDFDVLQYAKKTMNLYVMEKILEKFSSVLTDDEKNILDDADLWYNFAADLGYINLLALTINGITVNRVGTNNYQLLSTIKNCDDRMDYVPVVEFLIKNGADVNIINFTGASALDLACRYKRFDILKTLSKYGAKCTSGNTVLHKIIRKHCFQDDILQIIQELNIDINAKNDEGETALYLAVNRGCVQTVKKLLEIGCDCNILDSRNNTNLHLACSAKNDNTEMITVLLDQGIDVNSKNIDGCVPLFFACALGGCIDNVRCLIERNADYTIKDNIGRSSLHFACMCTKGNNSAIINLLLDNNIDIDAKSDNGETPLQTACFSRSVNSVTALHERNADFTVLDNMKNTVLHYASTSKEKNCIVINFVLDQGVNINAQNVTGQTALHLACKTGKTSNVKCLLNKNADLNIRDYFNNTTLHFACDSECDNRKIVKLVWNEGDLYVQNNDGKTPLDLAKLHQHNEIVELMELEILRSETLEDLQYLFLSEDQRVES